MNTSFPIHYIFRLINTILLICLLMFLLGCQVHNPLPGLCYTDKTGTYICPNEGEDQEEPKESKQPKLEEVIAVLDALKNINPGSASPTVDP